MPLYRTWWAEASNLLDAIAVVGVNNESTLLINTIQSATSYVVSANEATLLLTQPLQSSGYCGVITEAFSGIFVELAAESFTGVHNQAQTTLIITVQACDYVSIATFTKITLVGGRKAKFCVIVKPKYIYGVPKARNPVGVITRMVVLSGSIEEFVCTNPDA